LRKGRKSEIYTVSDLDPLGFRLERGFDSPHQLHPSTSMIYDLLKSKLHPKVTPFSLMFIDVRGVF